ncbi:conserved hypothetical protein [Paenibacillus curdlanolyticus YK9]|uniref:Uncharacterized protein n=1 Tax=Paenibacillus curdlanolyticus YK9 TaxID=717606 RepID=E0ICW4_9BACL|nr:hypothetical protein [Paenibacillus curdlanolyticus]EFM09679.1 conserved hypothetical protein [Paenibacillus curdlanolyticus YK9]
MTQRKPHATWLDDYLDLYNYAGQLQDTAWQEELLNTIRNGPPAELHADQELPKQRQKELWTEFQALNNKLIELFELIKMSKSQQELEGIRQVMWALKRRRLEIGRQLAA